MNRQWRGIGSYLMFFAVICMVLMFFESQMQGKAMYTYEQYEQAIDNADITSATITPNQETPTGTVTYTLKDGSVKTTNILNTEDEEETLKAAGISCDVAAVKGPGFFEPMGALIMCGMMFFVLVMTMGRKRAAAMPRCWTRKKPCTDDFRRGC